MTKSKSAHRYEYFLRMAVRAVPELKPEARKVRGWEARELHLIFAKIWTSGKGE